MIEKPDAPAARRNRDAILEVLRDVLGRSTSLLEIGSGTGQHAVYFGQALPALRWQTSDRSENHAGILAWVDEAGGSAVQLWTAVLQSKGFGDSTFLVFLLAQGFDIPPRPPPAEPGVPRRHAAVAPAGHRQVADPARKLARNLTGPLHDRVQIIVDLFCLQAEFLGALHKVEHFRGSQHRFGRDAAPVQANTAEMLAFDNGCLEAKLGGTNGGDVAAGAGANDDDVEVLCNHEFNLEAIRPLLERYSKVLAWFSTHRSILSRRVSKGGSLS